MSSPGLGGVVEDEAGFVTPDVVKPDSDVHQHHFVVITATVLPPARVQEIAIRLRTLPPCSRSFPGFSASPLCVGGPTEVASS